MTPILTNLLLLHAGTLFGVKVVMEPVEASRIVMEPLEAGSASQEDIWEDADAMDASWREHFQDFTGQYQNYFFGARYPFPKRPKESADDTSLLVNFGGRDWIYSGVVQPDGPDHHELRIRKLWRKVLPLQAIYDQVTRPPGKPGQDAQLSESSAQAFIESCKKILGAGANPSPVWCYASFLRKLWGIPYTEANYAKRMATGPYLPLPPVPPVLEYKKAATRGRGKLTFDSEQNQWSRSVMDNTILRHWREIYVNGPFPFATDREENRTQPEAAHAKTEIPEVQRDAAYPYSLSFPAAVRVAFARMFQIMNGAEFAGLKHPSLAWVLEPDETDVVPEQFTDTLYHIVQGKFDNFESKSYQQGRVAKIVTKIMEGGCPAVVGLCEFFDRDLFSKKFEEASSSCKKCPGGKCIPEEVEMELVQATEQKSGDTIALYYDKKRLTTKKIFDYTAVDSKAVLGAIFEPVDDATRVLVVVMMHNQQHSARENILKKFLELHKKIEEQIAIATSEDASLEGKKKDYIVMGDMNVNIEEMVQNKQLESAEALNSGQWVKVSPPLTYRTDLKSRKEIDYMFTSMEAEWGAASVAESQKPQNKRWESLAVDFSDHVMLKNLVTSGASSFPVVSWNVMDPRTLDAFDPKQIEADIVKEVRDAMGEGWTALKAAPKHEDFMLFLEEIIEKLSQKK